MPYHPPNHLPNIHPSSHHHQQQQHHHHSASLEDNENHHHHHMEHQYSSSFFIRNPSDHSIVLDHHQRPLTVAKVLATQPLRHELSSRPGPGGKKLTYLSGDAVSRTLNDVFGYDGWNLDIQHCHRVVLQEAAAAAEPASSVSSGHKNHHNNSNNHSSNQHIRHTVVYTSQVRVTHRSSGTYKEDCGSGEATDKSFGTAVANALKASITDAMKRAARHFGDKLGNGTFVYLYHVILVVCIYIVQVKIL
jgi:DNA repair and recombination protein RAD52